jgi:hypothetical protein
MSIIIQQVFESSVCSKPQPYVPNVKLALVSCVVPQSEGKTTVKFKKSYHQACFYLLKVNN